MMESGINADQNFYSRRQLPQSPGQHQQLHYRSSPYNSPPPPPTDSTIPPQPPKLSLLTTSNLQAISSNGFANGVIGAGEPDEFYRDYRGMQQSPNRYTDLPANTTTTTMTASTPGTRQTPFSLRANGNGTTPKHPSIPLTRNNIKPSYRSASSPLDDRQKLGLAKSTPALNGYAKAQQPSVKDLLKRFDQNNESSATTTRKPVPRTSTMKDAAIGGPGYARDRPGYLPRSANMQPGPARAGSVTREPGLARVKSPSSARPTQRNRFATEDQHSNNTLSSVARTHRPRITTAVNPSKSMSPISPSTTVSPGSTEKRPLFGEVVPSEQGVLNIGFGIPTATRRISDSSLRPPGSTRRRSRSDLDVSPSSPTAWYLGVTPDLDNVNPNKARKVVHNRAHSDFADNQVNILNRTGDHPSFLVLESPDTYKPRDSDARKSASRLPVSTNRQSNPSDGSSPESTRSNSPFATKATTNAKLRKPEPQPWSPAGRAKTPTSRAITPSHSTSRYRARTPEKLPTSNSSLKAYISAPPPKLSPPLRSSRPRQPVSSAATTANSRQKSGERSGSPLRSGMKLTRNNTLEDSRARKILDAGPVDFAARRARIQRAYTKSIQESEQKEIRAANLRRLTERHAKNGGVEERRREKTESASLPMQSSPEATPEISESLHISTSFSRPSVPVPSEERRDVREEDSPTLGMPGTFVDDDEPPVSAVSNVSGTTQIENEAQTEAARLALMPSEEKPEPETLSNLTYNASPDLSRNETGNDGGSIRVLLEATPVEEHKVHQEYIARDHYPQGAFQQDDDLTYNQAASNDAVISHKGTTIEFPVIETHLESSNDSDVHINKSNSDSMGDSTGQLAKSQADLEAEAYYSQVPSQNGKVEFDETPRLELPMLRTALSSSPTRSVEESEHEYLHTPFTDVGYESSDAAGHVDTSERYDPYGPSYDYRRHLAAGSYKTSRNSGWTDETVETDEYSTQEDHTYSQDDAKKPTPPPKVTIHELPTRTPPLPPKPDAYSSPEPSPALPLDKVATSLIGQFELPPLTTHNGFGLAYDEDPIYSVPSAPYWSEYSPPAATGEIEELKEAFPTQNTQPQPAQSLYSRRESSMYQSSHNDASRNAESRRTSDDVYSLSASTSTPRSSTQISVEELSATQSTDAVTTSTSTSFEPKQSNSQQSKPLQIDLTLLFPKSAQAAAKKRMLFKRSMIINELIDTESLYLKDMEVIKEIYKATADAVQQLEDSDVKCIFRNVEDIIEFTKTFLRELKAAGANVYLSKGRSKQNKANPSTQDKANASTQDKSNSSTDDKINSTTENKSEPATEDTSLIAALEKYKKLTGKAGVDEFEKVAIQAALEEEVKNQENEEKDRETFIGKGFGKHLDRMQQIYTEFLLHSEAASHRLSVLEKEAAVKVWLSECTIAAKDLTQAWSLDALLVKPVQRITRYQLILKQLLDETPADHPDHDALQATADGVLNLLSNINKMKERIQTVAKIVGRKRKESDVRGGLTKAFGRRIEKGFNTVRPNDDEVYTQLHDKFGEDYLRLQVVLRDVEYYTRHVTNWVNDFLRYLSSIELVMRMSASPYPELESKWARYNVHMRDMHTIALKEHVSLLLFLLIFR